MILTLVLASLLADPRPLLRAHAHNDYEHTHPLFDALDQGFCSVEADVYLVDGELRVGHDRKDLVPGKTLEKLYLDPLRQQAKLHHGQVYATPAPVTLLIDIKADGKAVYEELKKRLPKYRSILTKYDQHMVKVRAVTVILSGDRPIEMLQKEDRRYAFIDGRLGDLQDLSKLDPKLTPLVSDNFSNVFGWNGAGQMPEEKRVRLSELCTRAHNAGVRIRFWASPDTLAAWNVLYDAGADLLNTDDLVGLAKFLNSKP